MAEVTEIEGMTLENMQYLLADENAAQTHLDLLPLSAEEMERIYELLPPWSITSRLTREGGVKVLSTLIPARDSEHVRVLGEAFEDGRVDEGLIDALGGSQTVFDTDSHFWNGQKMEVELFLEGGPITLGDVKRVMLGEAYLKRSGYLLDSDRATQSNEE